ncbi:hypothetical protein PRIPAC_78526 [Pristionchus pacificus]|uniref:Nuclear receptor n=1 Tax=Pristionchus pacificus TaxID=54126 RepID=A0A8R1V3C5_PRIPA|nr:hypothetical protein PRIPAC_78526 [Pristionchus pacificus]
MQHECVICAGPVTYAHLGVNSCRRCAVFFKRATEAKTELKCVTGARDCIKLDVKSTCRLCRYTKITEILKNAAGDTESATSEDTPDLESPDLEPTIFINHESYYDCEPSTSSKTPLLERLRKGYSLMCLIRYGGELGIRTKVDKQLEIRVRDMVLVPATYTTFPMHGKACMEAMKAFANEAFKDFRGLDKDCKDFIVASGYSAMNSIDSIYRSMHHFPNNDELRTPGYTTYVRPHELETFFADCTDDVDTAMIASAIRTSLETTVHVARKLYRRLQPTDYEFLTILGLALWNDEISILNENMLKIVMRNRKLLMRELHTYYTQKGIANYARNSQKLTEDFELYKLMNLFKEYCDKNVSD